MLTPSARAFALACTAATLLMFSDQLAEALNGLDITRPESSKRFKRHITT